MEQLLGTVSRATQVSRIQTPSQGWIKTMRLALGISGAALSERLGGTRSLTANMERSEREGSVTLKRMQEAAEAMGCRFVYAIVPKEGNSIESMIEAQAERKAEQIIRNASVHMALESQELGAEETRREIERVKKQLIAEMPRDFWKDSDRE